MNIVNKLIFATSIQKVLAFLVENFEEEYQEKEISRKTGVKKSAVNLALHELVKNKLIISRRIGRSSLFSADIENNIIREIKILQNIAKLESLVAKLEGKSIKVILFGSFADGTNKKDSDIDLFVLSNSCNDIRRIINDSELSEKIQLIIKTPKEMLAINKKKPLLFQEIEKGKILFEKKDE